MLLLVSVLNPDGQIRPLMLSAHQFEDGWDVLNHFITSGYTILQAAIRDSAGSETLLPVEALDGIPIAEQVGRLQQEWEQILNTQKPE